MKKPNHNISVNMPQLRKRASICNQLYFIPKKIDVFMANHKSFLSRHSYFVLKIRIFMKNHKSFVS